MGQIAFIDAKQGTSLATPDGGPVILLGPDAGGMTDDSARNSKVSGWFNFRADFGEAIGSGAQVVDLTDLSTGGDFTPSLPEALGIRSLVDIDAAEVRLVALIDAMSIHLQAAPPWDPTTAPSPTDIETIEGGSYLYARTGGVESHIALQRGCIGAQYGVPQDAAVWTGVGPSEFQAFQRVRSTPIERAALRRPLLIDYQSGEARLHMGPGLSGSIFSPAASVWMHGVWALVSAGYFVSTKGGCGPDEEAAAAKRQSLLREALWAQLAS